MSVLLSRQSIFKTHLKHFPCLLESNCNRIETREQITSRKAKNTNKMIQIKHRITRNVILTIDTQNFTGTNLSGIDLSGIDLSNADLSWISLSNANLSGANLRRADLNYTDLSGANLEGANLESTNLNSANLRNTNLKGASIRNTNLKGANLEGANLDYSCLEFSCKSREVKTDRRQRVQLAHHLLSWMKYADNLNEDEKQIFEQLKAYANEFHINSIEKF